jgi:hypothetical protein
MNNRISSLRPALDAPVAGEPGREGVPARGRVPAARAEPGPPPRGEASEWWEGGASTVSFHEPGNRRERPRPEIDVFGLQDYRGRRVPLSRPIANMLDLGLSRMVGSLRVRSGDWEVCSGPEFTGECRILRGSGAALPQAHLGGSLRPVVN